MTRPTIAFEFFPPKNEEAAAHFWAEVPSLIALDPLYMTVTYGAGGTTKDGTRAALAHIQNMTSVPLACHLTFLSTTKADLDIYIDTLWNMNVRHIVALRGDLPKGKSFEDFKGDEYYHYTSDFVTALRQKYPFEISVGAYPEKHPDAPSMAADIEALRLKCGAGATRALTQFFFDNDMYYRFVETVQKAGITTPVYPGLLPIHDFQGLCHFASKCGASVPERLHKKFEGVEAHSQDSLKIATEILTLQVQDLVRNGINHLHFYTMNKSTIVSEVCCALGLSTSRTPQSRHVS